MFQVLALIALVATNALAHLEMMAPFQETLAPTTRVPFSSLKNEIVLSFYWDGSNDTFPYKIGSLPNATIGETYTVKLDLASVPKDMLTTSAKFTIQVVCHQPKFDIYQCADVVYDSALSVDQPSSSSATATLASVVQETTAAGVAPTTSVVTVLATQGSASNKTTSTSTVKITSAANPLVIVSSVTLLIASFLF
ncbi:hypothetical protein BCR33DRAFT_713286 [Rhizoclosmatium globosum]|uniref:Uncharacterized protein n=1 Tax=Rhizoclosmatium globosum TaxID=329046 RepID=A0A1Y2CU57_9FUNG|nr:hypothetical protein BCR33DRAFT_713286 [Rhizoclosmatium globosum]|eukprot:ORY50497.1 hypothetical protein BCR33DRAFT_713286 [Rhizoclosmatium globosum]